MPPTEKDRHKVYCRHIISVFKLVQDLLAPSKVKGKSQFQLLGTQIPVAIHEFLFILIQCIFFYSFWLTPDIRTAKKKIYGNIKEIGRLLPTYSNPVY